ncbi:MAG: putative DNA binding domain-containing protein [Desulfitobacteriaceae bacterium]|nr:putative DNA binding domain-containing protein [Desulfitobacteriaceae bacterium]MDI6878175.1 putative DNA binding domain-containing protein [Desulfitobacteriaceae bacterium]MDI6913511.1 putative DNA binding domain-containing protein [Desulfitobacteriaceae bacterium]
MTMLKAELLEIIRNGEGSGIEFKRDDVRAESLAKEIVALVNFKGGRIILGVDDDGQIAGITKPNLEEWVMNICTNYVHPRIIPYYEEIVVDNHKVAVITIDMGISKPYVVRHNHREDIYVRIGSTSRLASREEQARLFQSGGILHVETLPVPRTSFGSLDQRRLEDYFGRVRGIRELPRWDEEWVELLFNMEYMVETEYAEEVCTIVGLILFGREPKRHLLQAGLEWVVFPGLDKDYDTRDRATLDGPLVGLWNKRGELIEGGLLDSLMSKVRQHCSREVLSEDHLTRKLEWDFAPEAVREGVINAFVHRDWTRPTDIEVCLYDDRLEIISAGPLPNNVTVERMKLGLRVPRNPILVQTLRDYGYVEHMGMGVRNKIIKGMIEHNGKEPLFIADEDRLTVKLWR